MTSASASPGSTNVPAAPRPVVLDRVSFLVAGAQKGGTSALDDYLRDHPELCLATKKEISSLWQKEVHFFDTDGYFAVEPVDYAPYHARFEPRPPQRLLGEATPSYMYWPTAAERIARYNPAMKLIMVLRNPITRAFSHWNMARRARAEPLPFLEAIRAEPERRRNLKPSMMRRYSYVARGFYAQQLKRLWRYFPVEQTLISKSEQLLAEPNEVLGRIAAFLDIAPFPSVAPRILGARKYEATISDEEKRYLVGVYEDEIRELERLLDWDCSAWLA